MTENEQAEWLEDLFEYEYCAECGGDAKHHTVCIDPFGNPFARCDYPPIGGEDHPVIATYR